MVCFVMFYYCQVHFVHNVSRLVVDLFPFSDLTTPMNFSIDDDNENIGFLFISMLSILSVYITVIVINFTEEF